MRFSSTRRDLAAALRRNPCPVCACRAYDGNAGRSRGGAMVQVRIAGVALDATGQHVLLLKPVNQLPGDGLVLPIWVGQLEATSILVAIEKAPVPRPLAHDLMRSLLQTLGVEVSRVEVTRIDDGTF